jgi:hypothetical protein
MVPSGSSFFTLADQPPLDHGGSAVGPIGPSTLGSIIPPSVEEGEPFPGHLVVSSAPRARAVSHEQRADDEGARPPGW